MQSQQQQQPNYQQQQPIDPNAPQGHAQAFMGQAQQDGGYYGTPAPGPMGMVQQQPPPQQMPNQQQFGGGVPYGQYPPGAENCA
ncbi:hypothetical protein QFC21_001310 [Naganishia friedmannii]|uniref:Uncharacterized protein n=1 Tax=Naganishia friedmannii TaxID=89922 RepID=A0ACC2W4Z4_9TREE|nr:hypothetical protein QFC21_001310 [Naganishia friedmannii]